MKKVCSLAFVATLALSQIASVAQTAAQTVPPDELMTVTLYSPEKYKITNAPRLPSGWARPDVSRAYFNFTGGKLAPPGRWDLSYGTVTGFFVVGLGQGHDRSTITDLGRVGWNDRFKVPVVAALPELKPGEVRAVEINMDGKNGANGMDGQDGIDGGSPARHVWPDTSRLESMKQPARKPFSNLPILAKAVLGHMYAIHVVKTESDFYVLVHVDGFVPGDNCTLSWKRIPSP